MNTTFRPLALAAADFAGALLASTPAAAAESYDNCTGFIDSLPATISTQGVWCLRKHVSMNLSTGTAISIAVNNVTIDCNDFKIGGLAAGVDTQAYGIVATARLNTTVRRCGVRGFNRGIWLDGSGHLVEENRLDANTFAGIVVSGEGNRIVGNRVMDTGGNPVLAVAYGIHASGDVVDNAVDFVAPEGENATPYGIVATEAGAEVSGNRVRGLIAKGTGKPTGLQASGVAQVVAGNRVSGTPGNGTGILASGASSFCKDNVVFGFATGYSSCDTATGNLPVAP